MDKLIIRREVPNKHCYPNYPSVPSITVEVEEALYLGLAYRVFNEKIGSVVVTISKKVYVIGSNVVEYYTKPIYSNDWFNELDDSVKEFIDECEKEQLETLKKIEDADKLHKDKQIKWYQKLFKNTK